MGDWADQQELNYGGCDSAAPAAESCWEVADHCVDPADDHISADPWSPLEAKVLPPESYWADLEKAEYETALAPDGPEALELLPAEDDLDLPELSREDWEESGELFHSSAFERVDLLDDGDGFGAEPASGGDDFEIPDFESGARQAPWIVDDDDPVPRRAREKAAEIAALVDVGTVRQGEYVVEFLEELFRHLYHASTFRAIRSAAAEGLNSEQLFAMIELRRIWTERLEWWVGRYNPAREIAPLRQGPSALSWRAALRVCRARWDYPPEEMIDDEWLCEWQRLQPGEPGFLSFPAYIDVCIEALEASFLHNALSQHERNDGSHPADRIGWHRDASPEHQEALGACRTLFCPDNKSRGRRPPDKVWEEIELEIGEPDSTEPGAPREPNSIRPPPFAPYRNLLPPPNPAAKPAQTLVKIAKSREELSVEPGRPTSSEVQRLHVAL